MGQPVDLVLEGGGVKGIGLVGALAVLEEHAFEPRCVAGASAGAITAALCASRYGADELQDILLKLDFNAFKDEQWEDRIPLIGKKVSLLRDLGIYEGEHFLRWITEHLNAKGIRTFGDLRSDEDDPKRRYRLQVIASDLTERRLLVLPRDAQVLGVDPDELAVAFAVRMSMSIPVFFEPVRHRNPRTGREHLIVDGGMLSNFPVWLFDAQGRPPRFPTFGLLLVEPDARSSLGDRLAASIDDSSVARSIFSYVRSLVQTMVEAHDRRHIEEGDFARTITIPTLGVRTTDFDIEPERAMALYESGRQAAEKFLASWDFEQYIAAFRTGTPLSRRKALTSAVAAGVSET